MAILSEPPPDHPAREAYARDAGKIELTQLVTDRAELMARLQEAFLAGYPHMLAGSDAFRPD